MGINPSSRTSRHNPDTRICAGESAAFHTKCAALPLRRHCGSLGNPCGFALASQIDVFAKMNGVVM